MKNIKKNIGDIAKAMLLFVVLFSCLSAQGAVSDWGTTTYYTTTITQNGVTGRFYYTTRTDGGVNIVGIKLNSKPSNGDVIIIPETLGTTPVYGIRRFGKFYNYTLESGVKYTSEPLLWENAPDSYALSLPGSMKEVAVSVAQYAPTVADADMISAANLTALTIRPTTSTPSLRIGSFAFGNGFTNLTTVSLGVGVKTIDERAFEGTPLTTISAFPEGLLTIGDYAFWGATTESDLYLPTTLTRLGDFAFGTPAENRGWFFHNDLVIPASLKFIGYGVFSGSRKVGMKLVIPEGVEYIAAAVFAGTYISEVTLPSTLKELGGAFRDMVMLERVTFNANSVLTTLGTNIFRNCSSLRYIDMSKVTSTALTMSGLTREVGKTFGNLNPYTVVYLPQSQTGSGVVASGQENFVQYNGSEWKCANFVVYDYHAAYDLAYIDHTIMYGTGKRHGSNSMNASELAAFAAWKSSFPAKRGCDYELPLAFVADNAIFKRSFSATPTNQMLMTGSVPYSTTTAQAGIKCYKLVSEIALTGSYKDKGLFFISLDDSRLAASSLTTEEQTGCITANNPYVMQVTDASLLSTTSSLTVPATTTITTATTTTYHHLFASVNAKVAANSVSAYTTIAPDNATSTWQFVGHPMNISNTDAAANKLYTFSSATKKWNPVKTSTTSGYVHSFRAVMKYTGSDASYAKSFPLFLEADETTGISNIEATEGVTGKAAVYTIDGRYVGTSLDALPKGIYVVEGKKVVKQ